MIPSDIDPNYPKTGYSLDKLYSSLSGLQANSVTVFLDACFSGGGREQGLIAAKAVKIKPKKEYIDKGNLIVLAASSNEQEALFYDQKKHGIFTYCLLKYLQETKGEVTYIEIFRYLSQKVALIASDENYKQQNPQVNVSKDIEETWKNWKLNW